MTSQEKQAARAELIELIEVEMKQAANCESQEWRELHLERAADYRKDLASLRD